MEEEIQKDSEVDEIFSHIKQLKAEQVNNDEINQDDIESINTIKENTGTIGGETSYQGITAKDIFTIIRPDELVTENLSRMKVDIDSSGTCDICGKEIIFDENLSGLTIRGEFFSCEKCCQDASKETLDSWTEYKQGKPKDIIPIALWLMQEKNKTKLFD